MEDWLSSLPDESELAQQSADMMRLFAERSPDPELAAELREIARKEEARVPDPSLPKEITGEALMKGGFFLSTRSRADFFRVA